MFLSLCHYPKEKQMIGPPSQLHLKGLSLKKMTVFVTVPTRFAQVSKLPSFNTGAFPSGRDADGQPSLKTTVGYTNR